MPSPISMKSQILSIRTYKERMCACYPRDVRWWCDRVYKWDGKDVVYKADDIVILAVEYVNLEVESYCFLYLTALLLTTITSTLYLYGIINKSQLVLIPTSISHNINFPLLASLPCRYLSSFCLSASYIYFIIAD